MEKPLNISELKNKLEHYCAYQERCHDEVVSKLRKFTRIQSEIDDVVVHLINENFLNEERFAQAFARGKHRIKSWGKTRIVNELKSRNISQYNINTALKEIPQDDYLNVFHAFAERHWETISEQHPMKKRKRFCDFMMRKGYESQLVYDKAMYLERMI